MDILKEEYADVIENNKLYERGESNYAATIYEFSHLSNKEFADEYLGYKEDPEEVIGEFSGRQSLPAECEHLPAYKNWAEEGKLTEVQDQGCNDCYLFSSTSVLEAAVAIEYNTKPVKLSHQHVLECIKNFTKGQETGCAGGYPRLVWEFSKVQGGLVAATNYKNYSADSNGVCVDGLPRESRSEVDFWTKIPSGDEEAMKCHVALRGPIVVAIATNGTSLSSYVSGIFDDRDKECAGKQADHLVTLVGYGSGFNRKGELMDYWIVQNRLYACCSKLND
jgi:Papain family cysteine protease